MRLYLADTSAWHRSGESRAVAQRWASLLADGRLAMCAPVRLELLWSAQSPADYASRAADFDRLRPLLLDERAERAAAEVQAALARRSQHRGPNATDLLIAALAEVHGAILVHHDHHFDEIRRVSGQPMEWLPVRPGR